MTGVGAGGYSPAMTIARYQALCLDASDPRRLGRFWADVLGLSMRLDDDGSVQLTGATPQHQVWIDPVPEPRTVKNRLHLDVDTFAVDRVVAAGATVLDPSPRRWTVLADPEGGELCAFVREEVREPMYEIVWDCGDSAAASRRIAAWWADVLGAVRIDDERGFSYLDGVPGAPWSAFSFVPVPEPKAAKNRVHIDVDLLRHDGVDELVAAGATVLRRPDDDISWTILADPDGNEFCAFAPS